MIFSPSSIAASDISLRAAQGRPQPLRDFAADAGERYQKFAESPRSANYDKDDVMIHNLRCSCGAVKGTLNNPATVNRAICYCHDCQAFAHFLKHADTILDARGGTDIIQTQPNHINFSQGTEHIVCLQLTKKGLMRWYTRCCNTPIGNTMANYTFSFVGLIHNCLEQDRAQLDTTIGPVAAQVYTQSARGEPKPRQHGLPGSFWRLGRMQLRARFNGSYRQTPFFDSDTGKPVAEPVVLTEQQREQLERKVRTWNAE